MKLGEGYMEILRMIFAIFMVDLNYLKIKVWVFFKYQKINRYWQLYEREHMLVLSWLRMTPHHGSQHPGHRPDPHSSEPHSCCLKNQTSTGSKSDSSAHRTQSKSPEMTYSRKSQRKLYRTQLSTHVGSAWGTPTSPSHSEGTSTANS